MNLQEAIQVGRRILLSAGKGVAPVSRKQVFYVGGIESSSDDYKKALGILLKECKK